MAFIHAHTSLKSSLIQSRPAELPNWAPVAAEAAAATLISSALMFNFCVLFAHCTSALFGKSHELHWRTRETEGLAGLMSMTAAVAAAIGFQDSDGSSTGFDAACHE